MTDFKHLTQFELSAYHSGSLDGAEQHEIGRHLLTCPECRKLLPLPSVEKFWSAIMTENEPDVSAVNESLKLSISSAFTSFWNLHSNLVWSGGALIVILGFPLLIWFAGSYQPNEEREVTQAFNNQRAELKQDEVKEQFLPPPTGNSETETQVSSTALNRAFSDSKPTLTKDNQQKREQSLSENNLPAMTAKKVLSEKKKNISLTRGASPNCGNEDLLEMEFVSKEDAITFRWRKVPNALKYHLYISDNEEILIDEYETEQDTSYVFKKPLNPAKIYKWKVVITLEDGQTESGASQRFTVRDVLQNQKEFTGKKKSETRCEKNK